jgi:hypothetical protein
MLTCGNSLVWAENDLDSGTFLVRFDSSITTTTPDVFVKTRVVANFLVDPVEGERGRYRGRGRLRYTEWSGLAATGTDGVLSINDMQVSLQDGTVVVTLFPGNPQPSEWFIGPPPAPPIQFFSWFGIFGAFHINEFGQGGFTIDNWEYPTGQTYARKTYNQSQVSAEGSHQESTTIELIPVIDPPRIDKINIQSKGMSADDPETGEELELSADLFEIFPFKAERCTWTGNNISGSGAGDPEDNCRWSYTPKEGEGPERDTYGQKDLMLDVVFSFGADRHAITISKSQDYKVFFTKKGDDDSNSKPNWFDYWGDDGAVPGLDDSNVKYKASLDASTFAEADGTNVIFGPNGAGTDGLIIIPSNPICAGGTFPGGEGINLTALTLSHERKHNELDAMTGTDTDGDDVIDSAESGTSPTDPDSCDLAGEIDADYATYGDNEFIARLAELGIEGVDSQDWAVPGRQATLQTGAALSTSLTTSGEVLTPRSPQSAVLSSLGITLATQGTSLSADSILTGLYNAVGQDDNSDGLFDSMRLDIGVNVTDADHYSIIAWLADDVGTELLWSRTGADLGPGNSTLQLVYDGPELSEAGVTQPFVVSRVELYYRVGKHNVLADSAENVLDTGLVSADFNPPAATLTDTIEELSVDTGVDGLYDLLNFRVDLDINEPGEYQLSAQLHGSSLALYDSQNVTVAEGVNSVQVTLSFDGASIFFNRENGPYQLTQLRLTETAQGSELDFKADAWTTSAYLFSEFQQTGIAINENSYADAGGELDPDGKFITLDLTFEINSMVPGPYTVYASLEDNQGATVVKASAFIGLGGVEGAAETAMAILNFDGQEIFASGKDGPYQVADVTVISDAGIVMDKNPTPWLTAAYTADDFGVVIVTEDIFLDGFE